MGVSPAGGGRAVRGSACAPLLRNGSAAPPIPDADKKILEAYLHSGIPKNAPFYPLKDVLLDGILVFF